jgi:hypothetical protein
MEEEEERIRKLIEEDRLKSSAAASTASGPCKIKVRWSGGNYDKVGISHLYLNFKRLISQLN